MTPEFDPATVIRLMAQNGHNALVGLEYRDHGEYWCEFAMPYRDELVGDAATGFVASGAIMTMMDMACSLSIWLTTGTFRPQATLDLRVDYLRPAVPGRTLIGRGECYKVTKTIAFIRGEAHDGDASHPVAHVAGTYMFT